MSTKDARLKKDMAADEYLKPEPSISGGKAKEERSGNAVRYEELIRENETFFSIDLVKERLSHAHKLADEIEMGNEICWIMELMR